MHLGHWWESISRAMPNSGPITINIMQGHSSVTIYSLTDFKSAVDRLRAQRPHDADLYRLGALIARAVGGRVRPSVVFKAFRSYAEREGLLARDVGITA